MTMTFGKLFFLLVVGLLLGTALVWGPAIAAEDDLAAADEEVLRQAHVDTDAAGLLAFFRARSLSEADRREVQRLVRQLGDQSFAQRKRASRALIARGTPALGALKQALQDPDPEIARRAEQCIAAIESGPGPLLPAAAARLLVRRRPAGAVEALLVYIPFADDETVEEEVLAALRTLVAPDGKPHPRLIAALRDLEPARRAAAAHVLGRLNIAEQRPAVRRLLQDADARVRFRAARSLLAGGDREAGPALVALLTDAPLDIAWRAEEVLVHLAGLKAPEVSSGQGSAADRKQWRDGWAKWWDQEGAKVDLARLEEGPVFLRRVLIPEMHANRIWECDRDGKVRWEMTKLQVPIDAHYLPGGRLLIAEAVKGGRVSERNRDGKVLWQYPVDMPALCQRLANGNTFIGTIQRVFEVTRSGKVVFSYTPGADFSTNGYHRLRNGNVVLLSVDGKLREVSPAGKIVRSFELAKNRNWCGVEALPGNRYLVADCRAGEVLEVDATGKTRWRVAQSGAYFATRLPNGNTLVAHAGGIVEFNRAGKAVWKKDTKTAPWLVHWR
jgi:HEAT repeat protein